ncbi:MAG: hypothetical protein PUG83_01790, partial [Clostridiaceae bacterium]|nr:hypothetical protein [Clostridiaceae bacterium]
CGHSYTDEFDYGEHRYSDWTVTTEPTCTAEGEETRTCIICGESETRAVETRTHDLFHVEVASTCTVTGVSCDVCTLCGKIFNYSVLPLVEHTFSEWTVTSEPTCTAEGEETRTCSVCGEAETRTIEKAAHKIVIDTSVTPTCTETGVTEGQHCSVCGEILVEQQTIAATGHNDINSDGICDSCGEDLGTHTPGENCSCMCHKTGFMGFIYKIASFFWKMFKTNKYCSCGAAHY